MQYKAAGLTLAQFSTSEAGLELVQERLASLQRVAHSLAIDLQRPAACVPSQARRQKLNPEEQEGVEHIALLLCSVALAHLKLNGPSAALRFSHAAHEWDPDNNEVAWIHCHVERFATIEQQQKQALASLPKQQRS